MQTDTDAQTRRFVLWSVLSQGFYLRFSISVRAKRLQPAEIFPHPVQRLVDIFHRRCVRKANVLSVAEAFSSHGRDVRLMQQSVRNVGASLYAALAKKSRHIRISIKRSLRHSACQAWDRAHSGDNMVA